MLALGWNVLADVYSGQDVEYTKPSQNEWEMDPRSELAVMPFDAPLWVVGDAIAYQMDIGAVNLDIKDFYAYCETNPMTREVGGDDPLAHRVPEKPQKASKTKTKASAQPEATKAASRSLLDLMKKG